MEETKGKDKTIKNAKMEEARNGHPKLFKLSGILCMNPKPHKHETNRKLPMAKSKNTKPESEPMPIRDKTV